MLLNATPFAFVIDLACLASRREYLKLDKWLSDKIREHQEAFVQACVHFLKRRCPQLMGPNAVKEEPASQIKSQMLPAETVAVMLGCMQACVGNVAQELSEAIVTMVTNAGVVLSKARQAQAQAQAQQGQAPQAPTGAQPPPGPIGVPPGPPRAGSAPGNPSGAPGPPGPPSVPTVTPPTVQPPSVPGALSGLAPNPNPVSNLVLKNF